MNNEVVNQQEDDERSISQVSRDKKYSKVIALPLLAITALIGLYLILGGKDDEEEPLLIDPVEESFKSAKTHDRPTTPKLVVEKALKPEPVVEKEEAKPRGLSELERAALEEARRRREEELRKLEARLKSPILIVNKKIGNKAEGEKGLTTVAAAAVASVDTGKLLDAGLTPEEILNSQPGGANPQVAVIEASYIKNNAYMITQGTVIPGVLETAVDSSLPGFMRAVTSEDIYSFDGSKLLIPSQSTLIGRYQSDVKRGQHRVFVIWTRILRPDGASILINSPGTDRLGAAGMGGFVDNHFWEIFGNSILLSVISGGIQIAVEEARSTGDNSTTVIDGNSSLSDTPSIALENSINIKPTIHIDQGTKLNIFVAQDLDFSSTTL